MLKKVKNWQIGKHFCLLPIFQLVIYFIKLECVCVCQKKFGFAFERSEESCERSE